MVLDEWSTEGELDPRLEQLRQLAGWRLVEPPSGVSPFPGRPTVRGANEASLRQLPRRYAGGPFPMTQTSKLSTIVTRGRLPVTTYTNHEYCCPLRIFGC